LALGGFADLDLPVGGDLALETAEDACGAIEGHLALDMGARTDHGDLFVIHVLVHVRVPSAVIWMLSSVIHIARRSLAGHPNRRGGSRAAPLCPSAPHPLPPARPSGAQRASAGCARSR